MDPNLVGQILPGAPTTAVTRLWVAAPPPPAQNDPAYVAARQALLTVLSQGNALTPSDQQAFIGDAMAQYNQQSSVQPVGAVAAPQMIDSTGVNLFGMNFSWLIVALLGVGIYYVVSKEEA